ncbi:MAG TPA: DUF6688 family protein [Verrucomicrobiae bacterium]|nr:DUF6688 family protein [Verrucomicrobiae bacterium]
MDSLIGATSSLAKILAVLAAPALVKEWSLKRFLVAAFLSLFVVVLPLAFFLLSIGLAPDAKDTCHHGWIDCFITGKLALTPLVLWAITALYAVEIYGVVDPTRQWIAQGLFIGAVVSSVCLVFGSLTYASDPTCLLLLLVPLYTAVWYVLRAVHVIRDKKVKSSALTHVMLGSVPFWMLSLYWSYKSYLSLPDRSTPVCFVVTAASRGHRKFVGPFVAVAHRGQRCQANQQLATFWQFESLWRFSAPHTHALFRSIYNRVGPVIARRIVSPWLADAIYLLLKPIEIAAWLWLNLAAIYQRPINPQLTS